MKHHDRNTVCQPFLPKSEPRSPPVVPQASSADTRKKSNGVPPKALAAKTAPSFPSYVDRSTPPTKPVPLPILTTRPNYSIKPVPVSKLQPPPPPCPTPPPARSSGVRCCKCSRQFSKTFAMISHLESGACPAGSSEYQFYSTVAKYQNASQFIDHDDRMNMINGYQQYSYYPFLCPCCGAVYAKLEGLFTHIENGACGQDLYSEPISNLLSWMRNNI